MDDKNSVRVLSVDKICEIRPNELNLYKAH